MVEINIKNYKHSILGEMLVFVDDEGLWFMYNDVCKCLELDRNTSKHLLINILKNNQGSLTQLDLGNGLADYRFIHEQAVYKCMMRSDTKFGIEFQNWLSDIAYNASILDKTYGSHMNGGLSSRYYTMKETLNSMDISDPKVFALKNNFDKFGKGLIDENILSENIRYRTDYSIDEAYEDPYFNINTPSKKSC